MLSTFAVLLMLASQRIESVVSGWFSGATQVVQLEAPTKRGATPTAVEWLILAWVSGKLNIVLGFLNLYVSMPYTFTHKIYSIQTFILHLCLSYIYTNVSCHLFEIFHFHLCLF